MIEAIRRLLEEDFTCTWQPKIITFYTAKRTQFGPDGLSAIGMGRPNLHGLLVHLHNLLLGKPPQADFYKKMLHLPRFIYKIQCRKSWIS